MPLGDLEDEADGQGVGRWSRSSADREFETSTATRKVIQAGCCGSGFEAGIQAESFHPDSIIVDFSIGRIEALQICQICVAIPNMLKRS